MKEKMLEGKKGYGFLAPLPDRAYHKTLKKLFFERKTLILIC